MLNWREITGMSFGPAKQPVPALTTAVAADSVVRVERIDCRLNKSMDSIVLNWFSVSDALCNQSVLKKTAG